MQRITIEISDDLMSRLDRAIEIWNLGLSKPTSVFITRDEMISIALRKWLE